MAEEELCRSRKNKVHMVLCAALGRGHMTPMIGLARVLSATGEVWVTVVFQTKAALDSIQRSVFSDLDVEFAVLDDSDTNDDPPWMRRHPVRVRGASTRTGDLHKDQLQLEYPDEERALEKLLDKLCNSTTRPVCLVSDFTLPWTASPAQKFRVPRYVLYTDPACFMCLAYHVRDLVASGVFPVRDLKQQIVVPGLPTLYPKDVTQFVWDSNEFYFPMQDLWHKKLLESDGILLNTFYELESSPVDALRSEILPGKNFFTVGPLITMHSVESTVFRSPEDERDVYTSWLDSKPESSVVYISFGSWEFLPEEQITELAKGLEASGCSFLWVLTIPPSHSKSTLARLLPDGLHRRGLVVHSWVNQQEILKHRAIGAFLTHCGWNSVIECVSLGGVPMICWPFLADQPTACRYIVDGLHIGVEVCEDEHGIVSAQDVERVVKAAIQGNEMRSTARKMKEQAAEVFKECGSSCMNLKSFIKKASIASN